MKRVQEIGLKLVQCINISFSVRLGWTLEETHSALLRSYRHDCLHKQTVRFWFNSFVNGRTRLVDQFREPKRPTGRSLANIQSVKTAIEGDRRLTIPALARQTGVSEHNVQRILTKDLQLKRRSAKFVPAALTPNHLRQRLQCSQLMLANIRRTPNVLKKIVTMDETWVYMYDPESKVQSLQWMEKGVQRPTKPQRPRAIGKCMLVTFCDWKGMVHHEYICGQTINTAFFIQILGRYEAALQRKRPRRRYYLHMDNASPHTSRDTRLHLLFTGTRVLEHPPYSPDLAPSDFWLYPRMKKGLKGRWFANLDDLELAVDEQIGSIASAEYTECFTHKWPIRWACCVYRDGDYFEGLSTGGQN